MTCWMPLGRFVYRIVFSGSGEKWICSRTASERHAAGSSVPCSAAISSPETSIAFQMSL